MYVRHIFRQVTKGQGETILQFVFRLRAIAKDWGYNENTENQIRDEVLCHCCFDYLRCKLLEAGQELTLARTLNLAGQCEEVEMQMAKLSMDRVEPALLSGHVNRVIRDGDKLHGSHINGNKQEQQLLQMWQTGTFRQRHVISNMR